MAEAPSYAPEEEERGEEESAQRKIVEKARKEGLKAGKTEGGYYVASGRREAKQQKGLDKPETDRKPHLRAVKDGEKTMAEDEYLYRKLLAKKIALPKELTSEEKKELAKLSPRFRHLGMEKEGEIKELGENLHIEAGAHSIESTKHGNQDNFHVDRKNGVVCVADGLGAEGSEVGGGAASLLSSRLIGRAFEARIAQGVIIDSDDIAERVMKDALTSANRAIMHLQDSERHAQSLELLGKLGILEESDLLLLKKLGPKALENMKTTASAMAFYKIKDGDLKAVIGHIGDSRIYGLDKKGLEQITRDHDPITDALESGLIDEEDAKNPSKKISECPKLYAKLNNPSGRKFFQDKFGKDLDDMTLEDVSKIGVSKSIGTKNIQPDVFTIDVEPGKRYLLCTDGLPKNYPDSKIEVEMRRNNLSVEAIAKRLVRLARGEAKLKEGTVYDDDITALVVEAPFEEIREKELKKDIAA